MAKDERDIGLEIFEGIREIKRGDHGRVTTPPPVAAVREATGLSQAKTSPERPSPPASPRNR